MELRTAVCIFISAIIIVLFIVGSGLARVRTEYCSSFLACLAVCVCTSMLFVSYRCMFFCVEKCLLLRAQFCIISWYNCSIVLETGTVPVLCVCTSILLHRHRIMGVLCVRTSTYACIIQEESGNGYS